ncbi:FAD:protein FMN transferase [Flavobacterium sp.]|uniref:FAD:protein FMN transferase n=1 Tax=Flavobacterium sp. TaxID=239 RepID=UPI0038CFBE49
MKRIVLLALLFCLNDVHSQIIHKRVVSLLGSPFEITLVGKDTIEINQNIDIGIAEVKRIENLISDWIPTTPISEINRNAGIKPIVVSEELYNLVERAIKIAEITDGAFDISYASMDKIWKFDGSMKEMPSEVAIKESVSKIGYKNIILDKKNSSIYLILPGMKLGLGGIGQGYIADMVTKLLKSKGVVSGIINVSGDISTWGKQPNGKQWKVGIKNPMNKNKIFAMFPLEDSAVETSGSYEKFVVFNGIRYSHIIDPRTGYPAKGLVSVSVFAKTTEIADALATGIFVLGKEKGMELVNKLPGISCIMVDDTGKVYASDKIDLKKYKNE